MQATPPKDAMKDDKPHVIFTPDNQKLVVSGHHELTVWDIAQTKLEKRIYTRAERAYAMAFLPDGKLAVAGGRPGQEGDVRVYNLQGGTPKMAGGFAVVDGVNDANVMVKELAETDDSVLCLAAFTERCRRNFGTELRIDDDKPFGPSSAAISQRFLV